MTLPYDPRVVCNFMLDEADKEEINLSNLALQKLLYFSHARCLIEKKAPLVSGYFEAWQFGPVHPGAYKAFKESGDKFIRYRAQRSDLLSGKKVALPRIEDTDIQRLLRDIIRSYGRMTAGRLVELSHAKGAPWEYVVCQARDKMAIGMRISDTVILERFKYHKVSVGTEPLVGEPREDTPFARSRSGANRSTPK